MRLLLVVTVGTAIVGGTASASVAEKSKKVDTDKYAKVLCVTYNKVVADVNGFVTDISSLEITDNAVFQSDVATAGADLLTKLQKAETKLKSVYPDIDTGKKVSKLFAKNTVELQSAFTDALDTFAAADPNGVAFQADIAVLSANLTTLGSQLTDVTTQITDQDLIGSIGDEQTCHKIFPVTGG